MELLVEFVYAAVLIFGGSFLAGCLLGWLFKAGRPTTNARDTTPVPPAAPGLLADRQRVASLQGRAARRRGPVPEPAPRALSDPVPRNPWLLDETVGVDQVSTEQRMKVLSFRQVS